jgi:putative phosphoesterase
MKIGVVSDTHGFFDPALRKLLAGVDRILHAGDVDSQNVLDDLTEIAPVQAVRGNVDPADLNLPLSRTFRFNCVQVEMRHILPVQQSELVAWSDGASAGKDRSRHYEDFLKNFDQETRVVIFGHSHEPCLVTIGQTLFFNPGSAGKKRFALPRCCGLLEILANGIRGSIHSLDSETKKLPEGVWLPMGK